MSWSIVIVTNDTTSRSFNDCLSSIISAFSRIDFEVIVVGGEDEFQSLNFVKHIKFRERKLLEGSLRSNLFNFLVRPRLGSFKKIFFKSGAISQKKNLGAKCAKYENILFIHDYVLVMPDWLDSFDKFGLDWEVCVPRITNKDGRRYRDWCSWEREGDRAGLLPYDITMENVYISGTCFCCKRKFFLANPLDENLFWGEGEDIAWSEDITKITKPVVNRLATTTFTKLKPLDQAPYCKKWMSVTKDNYRKAGREFDEF